MDIKKLVVTFPGCEFDYQMLNCHKGVEDFIRLDRYLSQGTKQSFVEDLEDSIKDKGINEISLEMTTDSRSNAADPEREIQEILTRELLALNNIPVVAEFKNLGLLKTSAFIFNNQTELFSEIEPALA